MATNIYYEYVLKGLQTKLTSGTTYTININQHAGAGVSVLLKPGITGQHLVGYDTSGAAYRYPVLIEIVTQQQGPKELTQVTANVLHALDQYPNYTDYYNDLDVVNVDYDPDGDATIEIELEVTHNEVIL